MNRRFGRGRQPGEGVLLGVSVRAMFVAGITEGAVDAFVDAFLAEAIEGNGLWFGGGGSRESGWSGVVEPGPPAREVAAATLDRIREWLSCRAELEGFEISEAWDLWHGQDPFER